MKLEKKSWKCNQPIASLRSRWMRKVQSWCYRKRRASRSTKKREEVRRLKPVARAGFSKTSFERTGLKLSSSSMLQFFRGAFLVSKHIYILKNIRLLYRVCIIVCLCTYTVHRTHCTLYILYIIYTVQLVYIIKCVWVFYAVFQILSTWYILSGKR